MATKKFRTSGRPKLNTGGMAVNKTVRASDPKRNLTRSGGTASDVTVRVDETKIVSEEERREVARRRILFGAQK